MKTRAWLFAESGPAILIGVTVALCIGACGAPAPQENHQASAWTGADLPGVPGGFRAAQWDPTRNCLWVLTRYFIQAGIPLASLTRFNLIDRSTAIAWRDVPAQGYVKGTVAIDPKGVVWSAWGRVLIQYDPYSNVRRAWSLPDGNGVVQTSTAPGLDSNAVAMIVGQDNEIWVVAHGEQAIFGFNPGHQTWDRVLQLPFVPNLFTRLELSATGALIVNGAKDGSTSVLAAINPSPATVRVVSSRVLNYALIGSGSAIVEDDRGVVGRLDLNSGDTAALANSLPIAGDAHFVVSGATAVWFSMGQANAFGVGRLDLSNGSISLFPLPQPLVAGPGGAIACGMPPCTSPGAVFDPQIQSILLDGSGNVWVLTSLPGVGSDPHLRTSMSPLYELTPGS